jgi:serine phosphatase RsbU (regulator of sigma subunit)
LCRLRSSAFSSSALEKHFCRVKTGFQSEKKFVSALARGRAIYTSAAHCPAYMVRDGRVGHLQIAGNALGFRETIENRLQEFPIEQGDVFFLYTDGLFDNINANGRPLRQKDLYSMLNQQEDVEGIKPRFVKRLEASKIEGAPLDDVAFMVVKLQEKECEPEN